MHCKKCGKFMRFTGISIGTAPNPNPNLGPSAVYTTTWTCACGETKEDIEVQESLFHRDAIALIIWGKSH